MTLASAVVGHEVGLARAADRAEPSVRNVLKAGPGRDPAIRVPFSRVINEAAAFAEPKSC